MQTSAICRPTEWPCMRGFSLLELLAVLALIALLSSIALPRLDVFVDSFGAAHERETIVEAIASLGLEARVQRRSIVFSGRLDQLPGEIPTGWAVHVDDAIEFFPSGACSGGQVVLTRGQRRFVYELGAPRCRAILVD